MKRVYFRPTTEIVRVEHESNILATSPIVDTTPDVGGSKTAAQRKAD